jgi:hypothetical protein
MPILGQPPSKSTDSSIKVDKGYLVGTTQTTETSTLEDMVDMQWIKKCG